MKRFDYVRPATLGEALAATGPGAVFLAGGTNLLDLMKAGVVEPDRVIDIGRLPGLDTVEWQGDGSVRLGALARNADLAHDPRLAGAFPLVAEALLSGASPQVRNAATLAGNLLQRTRCGHFFDPASACNKRRPTSGCDAIHGDSRHAAVLGWSPACIATHPSDLAVAMVALDAIVEVVGPEGAREIPLGSLYRLPADDPGRETTLRPGDLVLAVRLPPEAAGFAAHARYLKLRERTSHAFALVSAAAALRLDAGAVVEARIALGGVAHRPWRARGAEAVLAGAPATQAAFRRAADVALAEATPSGDNRYKIELARRLVVRALTLSAAGTPDRMPALPGSPLSAMPDGAGHA